MLFKFVFPLKYRCKCGRLHNKTYVFFVTHPLGKDRRMFQSKWTKMWGETRNFSIVDNIRLSVEARRAKGGGISNIFEIVNKYSCAKCSVLYVTHILLLVWNCIVEVSN